MKRLGIFILGCLFLIGLPSAASAAVSESEQPATSIKTAEIVVVGSLVGAGGAVLVFVDRMQHGHVRRRRS